VAVIANREKLGKILFIQNELSVLLKTGFEIAFLITLFSTTDVTISVMAMCCDFYAVTKEFVRFQVLTAASMMFRVVFWVVLPCKMIVDRRFRGPPSSGIPDDGGSTHL
jgi:hypothetical protein